MARGKEDKMNDKQNLIQILLKQNSIVFTIGEDFILLELDNGSEVHFTFDEEGQLYECWQVN